MKHIRLIFIISLLCVFSYAYGQDYDTDYYFVYIAHDQTGSGNLINVLEQDYQSAIDEEQTWVFYLANGNNPIMVEVSPENHNKEEFEKMLELIGRNERLECFAYADLSRLMAYFNKEDFADDDGYIRYNSVSWRIYITPQFWNTESDFISDLFWVFDFHTLNENNGFSFTFEVYLNKSHSELRYDEQKPFGIRNIGNINDIVGIMDYESR